MWKALWRGGNVSYQGKHFSFTDVLAEPTPVQKPHPPIWVGSAGPRVLRRVVELGDGWHPIGMPDLSFARLEASIARLDELRQRMGRRDRPVLSYSGLFGSITKDPLPQEGRQLLSGSVDQVADDLRRFKEMGFGSVLFRFGVQDGTPQTVLDQMELCADAVLPRVR